MHEGRPEGRPSCAVRRDVRQGARFAACYVYMCAGARIAERTGAACRVSRCSFRRSPHVPPRPSLFAITTCAHRRVSQEIPSLLSSTMVNNAVYRAPDRPVTSLRAAPTHAFPPFPTARKPPLRAAITSRLALSTIKVLKQNGCRAVFCSVSAFPRIWSCKTALVQL